MNPIFLHLPTSPRYWFFILKALHFSSGATGKPEYTIAIASGNNF